MNVSTVSSSNDYSQLMGAASTRHARRNAAAANSAAGAASGTSSSSNPFEKALDSLESALSSGDTSTAQSVLSGILSHAPKSPAAGGQDDGGTTSSSATGSGSSTGSANPGDKIGSLLNQIKSDLASGDTSSAESAVSSLKDYLSQNAPPPPPPSAGAGIYSTDGNFSAGSSNSSYALSSLA